MIRNIGCAILCSLIVISCTENKKLTSSNGNKLVGKWAFEKSVVRDSQQKVQKVFNSYSEMTQLFPPNINDILEFYDDHVAINYPTKINKEDKFTIKGRWQTKGDSIIIRWSKRIWRYTYKIDGDRLIFLYKNNNSQTFEYKRDS